MSTDTPLCAFVPPGGISRCGYPQDHGLHRDPSIWSGSHPFVPPPISREYLVDSIGQILCTFRLAGGPCGKDSFDTVHRAHTDHPGYCGVYTCHAFRPEEDRAKRIEDAVREAIKELRTNICTREVIASYLEGALG